MFFFIFLAVFSFTCLAVIFVTCLAVIFFYMSGSYERSSAESLGTAAKQADDPWVGMTRFPEFLIWSYFVINISVSLGDQGPSAPSPLVHVRPTDGRRPSARTWLGAFSKK